MIGGFGFGVIGAPLYIYDFWLGRAMQPANRVLYRQQAVPIGSYLRRPAPHVGFTSLYRPQPPLTIAGILSAMIGGFGFGVIGLRLYILGFVVRRAMQPANRVLYRQQAWPIRSYTGIQWSYTA